MSATPTDLRCLVAQSQTEMTCTRDAIRAAGFDHEKLARIDRRHGLSNHKFFRILMELGFTVTQNCTVLYRDVPCIVQFKRGNRAHAEFYESMLCIPQHLEELIWWIAFPPGVKPSIMS